MRNHKWTGWTKTSCIMSFITSPPSLIPYPLEHLLHLLELDLRDTTELDQLQQQHYGQVLFHLSFDT